MISQKLFLIGMPGSGKSTVAGLLAQETGLPYIDLDIVIETMQGKSISQIFNEVGEDGFRQLESKVLSSLIASNEPFILATGGGTPCFFNHINQMKEAGTTVYLKTELSELVSRTLRNKERPLLENDVEETMADLLLKRTLFYEQANQHINTEGKSAETIAKEIAALL